MASSIQTLVCSAPGRAGIIGNPTDGYGGCVLSCTIPRRARVRISKNQKLVVHTNGESIHIQSPKDLVLGKKNDRFNIIRAIFDRIGIPEEPFKVEYQSDIPYRRGLSGSTSLLITLLFGILKWLNKPLFDYELAEEARYIEYHHLNIVCGFQDVYMAVSGGMNFIDFEGKTPDQDEEKDNYNTDEPIKYATVEPINIELNPLPFLVVTTRVEHDSSLVHSPIRQRWLEKEPAVREGYKEITQMAKKGKDALIQQDWEKLGQLMNDNHKIQHDLGGSGESNEIIINAAVNVGGAYGAKLAGAGKGGTIIVLWPDKDSSEIEKVLYAAGAENVFRPSIEESLRIDSMS